MPLGPQRYGSLSKKPDKEPSNPQAEHSSAFDHSGGEIFNSPDRRVDTAHDLCIAQTTLRQTPIGCTQ